ncbi:MAG: hypothetical protein E7182_03625 [Erysipelotrichaceae bacterium]|nr:hypothetical protein [Erysipelotrichaceae bacterium]
MFLEKLAVIEQIETKVHDAGCGSKIKKSGPPFIPSSKIKKVAQFIPSSSGQEGNRILNKTGFPFRLHKVLALIDQ